MKKEKIFILVAVLFLLGIGLAGWQMRKKPSLQPVNLPNQESEEALPMENPKKVLVVIAFQGFKDEEYFKTREELEKAGFKIEVASDSLGKAQGADGGEVEVNHRLEDVKIEDYDALVFIGGPKALEHLDNETSYQLARHALKAGKIVAAICISPVILAKAGLLEEKKATVWTSPLDKSPQKILEEHGATFTGEPVARDGNIITANGPAAAQAFGETIASALQE